MLGCVDRARFLLTKATYQYLLAITLGVLYGIILNVTRASYNFATIVTLPGPLFLRSLQCAVIPMMFFNITVSVTNIFSKGNGLALGKKILFLYSITTIFAVINGICIANIFGGLFISNDGGDEEEGVDVKLKCPGGEGRVTVDSSGNLICLTSKAVASFNLTEEHQTFELLDEENLLVNGATADKTLLEEIVSSIFESLFPSNAVESFAIPNIISVIVISITLGAAIVHLNKTGMPSHSEVVESATVTQMTTGNPMQRKTVSGNDEEAVLNNATVNSSESGANTNTNTTQVGAQLVLKFCVEMSNLCNTIINWIISIAPLCMGFLIAQSLAQAGSLLDLLRNVGVYTVTCVVGLSIHTLVVLPALLFYYTRENPYSHIYSCRKAMLMALSTASSAATLPVTIQCCLNTKKVSPILANVVLPMGATVNMDGSALGFPCVMMFLAHADHLASKFNVLVWCNIALGSSFGSMGAAPVPSAGLVTMITVWQTAFPNYDVPSAISYVQAIDFFVDRLQTCTNVVSDIVIVTILQVIVDEEERNIAKRDNL